MYTHSGQIFLLEIYKNTAFFSLRRLAELHYSLGIDYDPLHPQLLDIEQQQYLNLKNKQQASELRQYQRTKQKKWLDPFYFFLKYKIAI